MSANSITLTFLFFIPYVINIVCTWIAFSLCSPVCFNLWDYFLCILIFTFSIHLSTQLFILNFLVLISLTCTFFFMSLLISRNDQFLIMLCLCYHGLPLPLLALSNVTWIYHSLGGGRNYIQLPAKWTGHKVEAAKSGVKLKCRFRFVF